MKNKKKSIINKKKKIEKLEENLYTFVEELFHSISHGIGTILGIAALVILVAYASIYGNAWHIVSCSIFGASLIILYTSSTLYHSLSNPRAKRVFKIFDHSAIYILIAGSYTPFCLIPMRGQVGWTVFGIIWGLAILGVLFKIVFIGKYEIFSGILYLAMGWLCVMFYDPLLKSISSQSLTFLVSGGLSYTLGFVFYAIEKLPYNHAIWHLFVLGGSILHFFSVIYLMV